MRRSQGLLTGPDRLYSQPISSDQALVFHPQTQGSFVP